MVLTLAQMELGDKFITTHCSDASSCETVIGSTFYDKLEAAGAAGIINVFAAGNESNDNPLVSAGAACMMMILRKQLY